MADKCILCGKDVSPIFGKRCKDGHLCKECVSALPQSISREQLSAKEARQLIAYEKEMKSKDQFSATVTLGRLYLDEMHGMFALVGKTNLKGEPIGSYDLFPLTEVTEIGIYPINPRNDHHDIVCDIEFQFVLNSPPVTGKAILKTGVKCSYKRINQSHVEWQEPEELSLFRNMLRQCSEEAVRRRVAGKLPSLTLETLDLFQAQSAFFLREGYTAEEIRDHRKKLLNAFCNTDDAEENATYTEWIETCYQRLMDDVEKKENRS